MYAFLLLYSISLSGNGAGLIRHKMELLSRESEAVSSVTDEKETVSVGTVVLYFRKDRQSMR